jgi:HSP20 family protein
MAFRRKSIWELFREIEREITEEAERIIREIKEMEARTGCLSPLYEVFETDDALIISVDLPGSNRDEISLEISEGILKLEAPCRKPIPGHGEKYTLQLRIPEHVNPEGTTARYQNGVLEIRIPKKRPSRGVRIKVE